MSIQYINEKTSKNRNRKNSHLSKVFPCKQPNLGFIVLDKLLGGDRGHWHMTELGLNT